MARQSLLGQDLLYEVPRSHSDTPHSAILLFTASGDVWIENGVAGFGKESNADGGGCTRTGDIILEKL